MTLVRTWAFFKLVVKQPYLSQARCLGCFRLVALFLCFFPVTLRTVLSSKKMKPVMELVGLSKPGSLTPQRFK